MTPRVSDVYIENYKSIAQVHTTLAPFTALVGPNGAGKSNFIDCLAFVQECLSDSVELAFKNRGGIAAVRRRSGGHPTHIGVRLGLVLDEELTAEYAFRIAAKPRERFSVARERCVLRRLMAPEVAFDVRHGEFHQPIPDIRPRISADRLALFAASATEEFRPVYDFLTSMRFYSVEPGRLRELQDPDPGDSLKRDGSNAAAVLKRLAEVDGKEGRYERVCQLLSKVVEGLEKVEYRAVGQKETLEFRQDVGLKHPWRFAPLSMSDGTLRVLGLLLAVYQPGAQSLVAIEEPEATVHPAVSELVVQVLLDAAEDRQVVVTTHSPDILDDKELGDTQLRAVITEENRTLVCPVSGATRDAIREQLYTPGELLRSGELNPDAELAKRQAQEHRLFSPR
ncbi:MAG: AAA family ATPase [Planctomycetota bacterium]